jgi:hypothetical protein
MQTFAHTFEGHGIQGFAEISNGIAEAEPSPQGAHHCTKTWPDAVTLTVAVDCDPFLPPFLTR